MRLFLLLILVCSAAVLASEPNDPNRTIYDFFSDDYSMPETWGDGYSGNSDEDGWMLSAFKKVWNWFYDYLLGIGEVCINLMLGYIPTSWAPNVVPLLFYFEVANSWVALDYGFSLLGVYYSSLLVFIIVKFILKLIPTVG